MGKSTTELNDLLNWLKHPDRWPNLSRVTLGQLVILLELYRSQSVAAASRSDLSRQGARVADVASVEVNYRQKLRRLSAGLGVEVVSGRNEGRSCLSDRGEALAQELQILLTEVRGKRAADQVRLHIAAGDSWLHSVVLPVVLDNRLLWKHFTWKVSNLSAPDVIRGLKDGRVHFGLIRKSDLPRGDRELSIAPRGEWSIESFSILVGSKAPKKPSSCDSELVMKTLCKSVLVLHGNPFDRVAIEWNIRAREAVGDGPVIECDTHLQAALAVQGRDAWCVVPSRVADLVNRLGAEGKCGADVGGWCQPLLDTTVRKAELASDALCLVTRERELERISGADKVLSKLTIELAKKFRT